MPKESDESPRTRIAHIFRVLLEQPNRYTIRELAEKHGIETRIFRCVAAALLFLQSYHYGS